MAIYETKNKILQTLFWKPFHVALILLITQEDTMEETGWKLVHGDVFRPPKRAWLLTAFVGSGVQIFFMVLITLGKRNRDQPTTGHVKFISETCFNKIYF